LQVLNFKKVLLLCKETFKRDLQKRHSKETFKRDLQKRPSKETFKRDLHIGKESFKRGL